MTDARIAFHVLRAPSAKSAVEEIPAQKCPNITTSGLSYICRPQALRATRARVRSPMYLCKKNDQPVAPEIGRRFGGRDHTTLCTASNASKSETDDGQIAKIWNCLRRFSRAKSHSLLRKPREA